MTKYDTKGAFEALREDPFLPPAPAPRKSRKSWVIAGTVVGMLGLAAGTGAIAAQSNSQPEPSTATEAPSQDLGEAAFKAADLVEGATNELDLAIAAGEVGDVTTMVSHVRGAGSYWDQVSTVWDGVDSYLSSTAAEVASHIYASADYVENGDFPSATAEMQAGTALIDEMTTYAEGLV